MIIRPARRAAFACVALALVFAAAAPAKTQSMSLIRDAEIEDTIRAYAAPLLEAAGLGAGAVRLHIVNDSSINAFVAGGPNLFISSGMLAVAEEPGEIIGVIAHEIGHIAAGHLVRAQDAMEHSSVEMILAAVLGAGAIIAGQGDAGIAIITGGQAIGTAVVPAIQPRAGAERRPGRGPLPREHRTVRHRSPADVPEAERGGAALPGAQANPYLRTHPLTTERIRFVRNRVAEEGGAAHEVPEALRAAQRRMAAKLRGFLDAPQSTLRAYPADDESTPALYARAIAYYRIPDLERVRLRHWKPCSPAIPTTPGSTSSRGRFSSRTAGWTRRSHPTDRAVALRGDAPLLRYGLARAQIETGDAALLPRAIEHLEAATRLEGNDPSYWYQLGIARGRAGERAAAALALAEAAYLRGDIGKARHHATVAAEGLPHGSARWLRAEDIRNATEVALAKKR